MGRSKRLTLDSLLVLPFGPDFKALLGAVEAGVELHEEVHLTEDQGDFFRLSPGERKLNGRERTDYGFDQKSTSIESREIASQLNRNGLRIPVCAQLHAEGIREHIDGGTGVQQPEGRQDVRPGMETDR